MRRTSVGVGLFLALSLLAAPALAVRPTTAAPQLELTDGADGSIRADVSARPTSPASARWLRVLEADVGAPVRGMFHAKTGIPLRTWGFSVPARDASASAEAAAKHARAMLERHVSLLAPGAAAGDFALAVNHLDQGARGQRTVAFHQRWRGMPVLGGVVSFRYRGDRLFAIASDALPAIDAAVPAIRIDDDAARAAARAWILDGAARATAGGVEGPMVLPLQRDGRIEHRVVVRVRVDAEAPLGAWDVFVDAGTGEPVARRQTLHFETAQLALGGWARSPHYGPRVEYAADRVSIAIGESQASGEAAPDGSFSFEGDSATGTATLVGSHVRVLSSEGAEASFDFDASAGAKLVWSSEVETIDAQLNAYAHADEVNAYARTFAPDLAFLDDRVQVTVNIEDVCNAYSDGRSINFFKAGSGCENTGRIADVVYHEYGHSLHANAYLFCGPGEDICIPVAGGDLSEGISDYLAATMTGDPAMGRGFFSDDAPLRHIDPQGAEHVWPTDALGEVHYDGLIIAGALWDLRTLLIDSLGEDDGVARTDWLMFEGIRRSANMPEMYAELLFADDDDGDLANGTPNECAINTAFARHGLRPLAGEVLAPSVGAPTQDGYEVEVEVLGLSASCGETLSNAYMTWSDPADVTRGGLVDMVVAGDSIARGTLPPQPEGHTIRFDVRIENAGAELHFPVNAADPSYQLYVGEVTPIACFDFETDPFAQGWAHELVSGAPGVGADDWMWGAPDPSAQSGDPLAAFGGTFVVGQDLSPPASGGDPKWDGHYQADKHTALVSPVIDVTGWTGVHLQYRRWLNVEDAHFDQATILAGWDGQHDTREAAVAWRNYDSMQGDQSSVHHADREWRFHDVDLTPFVRDGQVQVRWELRSDGGLEMGGWTLDDVCVVGVRRSADAACDPASGACPPGVGGEPDGGSDGRGDDAADVPPEDDGGCGCTVVGGTSSGRATGGALAALVAAAGVAAARRRRSR